MKKQINQCWQSLLLVTIAAFFIFCASAAIVAQEKSIGAKYGSREPRTCADMKVPAKGAITAALAAKYFICASEVEKGQYLYLVENVKTEVGAGRPYNPNMDLNVPEIDVRSPLYPIRGSHTLYQCDKEDARFDFTAPGRNCHRYEHQNAKGFCYKTTFGDWRCYQTDLNIPNGNIFNNVPPPKGDKNAAGNKTATNDKPANTKIENPTLETENKTTAGKDENGLVKPDFSEMEKYFDDIKYEYDFNLRRVNIIGKMKKATNPNTWLVEFYDADGAKLSSNNGTILIGLDSSVGQVVKVYTNNLPSEKQMREVVKKIVITRKID
ncbi:MAG TPA: hypothetical protein VK308_10865 [Pyrinomonadaceae bacterium]|nr:hypothetical protein [Pyrinomonadaceae bacterium]